MSAYAEPSSGGVPSAHVGDEKRQLGPCVNPDCDADGECTCPGDSGFVGPVEPVADTEAVETARRVPEESYTITTECRANRGDGGAWDEAAARLRVVYNAQLARFGPAAVYRLEFHREPAPGVPRYVYDAARDSRPVALPTARDHSEGDSAMTGNSDRLDDIELWYVESQRECPQCGHLLGYRDKFCAECSYPWWPGTTPVPTAREDETPTISDRGFKAMDPIHAWPEGYDGTIRVSESSAAGRPCLWVRINKDREDDHQAVHLTVEDAARLRDQITYLIEHHYQGASS